MEDNFSTSGDGGGGVCNRTTQFSSNKVSSDLSEKIQVIIDIGYNKTKKTLTEYKRRQHNIREV